MNLFLNERDGWEVWRGESLSSARLVACFGTHAEALAFYDHQEISRLKERIAELEEFVSACRYAGPDGIEQLKKESQELLIRNY